MDTVQGGLPALQAAWAAGFVDGEGSIGVYNSHNTLSLHLNVGQVDPRPLEKLCAIFGGHYRLNRSRSAKGPIYDWKLHGKAAASALQAMLPYLTTKLEQAELAIEFQGLQQTSFARVPVPEAVAERKRWIADELKRLKKEPTLKIGRVT